MPHNKNNGNKKPSNAPRPKDRAIGNGVNEFRSAKYNKTLRFDTDKQCAINYREWFEETKIALSISDPLTEQIFDEVDWRPQVIDPNAAVYQIDPNIVGAANIRADREKKDKRLLNDENHARDKNEKMYLARQAVFSKIISTLSDESKQLVETHLDYRTLVENRNNVEAKNPFQLLRVIRETHIISQKLGNSVQNIRQDFTEKLILAKRASNENAFDYLKKLKRMWDNEKAWVDSHQLIVAGVVPPVMVVVPINTIEQYTDNFMKQVAPLYPDAYVDYYQRINALVSPAPRFDTLESAFNFVVKFVTKESLGIDEKTKGDDKRVYAIRKDVKTIKEAMKKQAKQDRGKNTKPGAAAGAGAGAGGGQVAANPCLVCKWYLEKAGITSPDLSTICHFHKRCPYKEVMSYSNLPQDFRDRNPVGSKKRKSRDAKALATVLDGMEDDDSEDDTRHGKKVKR